MIESKSSKGNESEEEIADTILAVDTNMEVFERQAAEWEKVGVNAQRVDTMFEATTELDRGAHYLFIAINEDAVPAFQSQLPILRAKTKSLIFVVSSHFVYAKKASVINSGADAYDQLSESAKENVRIACEMLKRCYWHDRSRIKKLPVLIEGNVIVAPGCRMVFVDDIPVNLKKTEFDILEYFVLNRDIVLTYRQIFDRIWGCDYDENGNNLVWYHVHSLRRQLQKSAGIQDYIVTVKDVGYRFCIPQSG